MIEASSYWWCWVLLRNKSEVRVVATHFWCYAVLRLEVKAEVVFCNL